MQGFPHGTSRIFFFATGNVLITPSSPPSPLPLPLQKKAPARKTPAKPSKRKDEAKIKPEAEAHGHLGAAYGYLGAEYGYLGAEYGYLGAKGIAAPKAPKGSQRAAAKAVKKALEAAKRKQRKKLEMAAAAAAAMAHKRATSARKGSNHQHQVVRRDALGAAAAAAAAGRVLVDRIFSEMKKPSTIAVRYPPTAVGYLPTTAGYSATAVSLQAEILSRLWTAQLLFSISWLYRVFKGGCQSGTGGRCKSRWNTRSGGHKTVGRRRKRWGAPKLSTQSSCEARAVGTNAKDFCAAPKSLRQV